MNFIEYMFWSFNFFW